MNAKEVMQTKICVRGNAYWRLMRFDKPIGIFLLLWPAMWALWVSGKGNPAWLVSMVIIAGVVIMRAAGCVINDYADRNFDPHVERTRLRPLASGEITPKEALVLFVMLQLNFYTIALSFVGAFLAASYPFMKRVTHLPQAYLGVAFGWAVPMTFAAQNNMVSWVGWELFVATVLWALIYDTMYAMVDKDDDIRIGVKSTAILFGKRDREIIGVLQVSVLAVLAHVGVQEGRGGIYLASLLVGGGLFVYQQCLIFEREKTRCFRAFLNNHWFGATVFAGMLLDYRI